MATNSHLKQIEESQIYDQNGQSMLKSTHYSMGISQSPLSFGNSFVQQQKDIQKIPTSTYQSKQNLQTYSTVQGSSRIEYKPIEKSAIEYQTVEQKYTEYEGQYKIEYVPVQKSLIQSVPVEKKWTEYEAVEYQTEFIPKIEYETIQEQVPVKITEYVPVTTIEYVPQYITEYQTQERLVERTEYNEVEYIIPRGTIYGSSCPETLSNNHSNIFYSQII